MKKRFEGPQGHRLLIDALREQQIVAGNADLATAMAEVVELQEFKPGDVLIEQGATDNDMYLVLSGTLDVVINGKTISHRSAGTHVGEMAAVEPTQARSATVLATTLGLAAKLSEANLSALGQQFPDIWRWIAKVLSRRLLQRNRFVADARDKIRIFIISSKESLEIGQAIQNAFEHDGFVVTLWTNDVFRASQYPIDSLEAELDVADFAIAIVQPDDMLQIRGEDKRVPRDNVVFELGFFMGRLGRLRAVLLEPRGDDVKLPSDLAGITTIPYKYAPGRELATAIAPACNRLRSHIKELGPVC